MSEVKFAISVRCWPVHSKFRFPVSPAFSFTDNLGEQPRNAFDDSSEWHFDLECGVAYPAFIAVPHNNYVTNEDPITTPAWYNTNLPTLDWVRYKCQGRLKWMGGNYKAPGLRAAWTSEPARAIYYAYAPTNTGSSTRYNFNSSDNQIELWTQTFSSIGFHLQVAFELEPRDIHWTTVGGAYKETFVNPANSKELPYFEIKFRVEDGQGGDPTYYSVVYRSTGTPALYKSTSVAQRGDKIQDLKLPPGANPPYGASQQGYYGHNGWYSQGSPAGNSFEAKIIAGILKISLGDLNFQLKIGHDNDKADGKSDNQITRVFVFGAGVKSLQLGCAPLKHLANATLHSREINVGFVPQVAPTFKVHYPHSYVVDKNPYPGTTVTVTPSQSGSIATYTLTANSTVSNVYQGVNYSDIAPIVRSVTINFAEKATSPPGIPIQLSPEDVTVSQDFNFDSLTMTSKARLVFNNFNPISSKVLGYPDIFWGELANYSGAMAVEIDATIYYFNTNGTLEAVNGPVRLFTGYAALKSQTTTGQGGQSKHTIYCFGREVSMQSVKNFIPWTDGWNIYYAAAYVANSNNVYKGDVQDSDLAFRHLVPNDPYEDSPGGGAYFLPVGTGGYPLMKAPGGESGWATMSRIGKQWGYYYFFDNYGRFNFDKYELVNANAPYRVFTIVDGLYGGTNPTPTDAVLNGVVDRNLLDVRNRIVVVGIGAYSREYGGVPILAYRTDQGSIEAPGAQTGLDFTQGNYLGFPNYFTWADSQFATYRYIEDAAQRLYDVMRIPSVTLGMTTWCQPDVFPGKRLGFYDLRTGAYDRMAGGYLEFMVASVNHRFAKGSPPISEIACRYIPRQF